MRRKAADLVNVKAAAILLVFSVAPAAALDEPPAVRIPALPATASSAERFAPAGWKVEATAHGDLDRDGRADLALVLRGTDPANILKNDGMGPPELDTNPRILGVAVADAVGYRLVVQNNAVIPRHVEPNLEDPFSAEGLSVARGAVKLALSSFANAGGWESSNVALTFRLRRGRLEMAGYDRSTIRRNTGVIETVSVNYLTGRMSRATGSIESDQEKKTWSPAPANRGPSVEEIGDGLAFDPAR
jgi:hypothetical protein